MTNLAAFVFSVFGPLIAAATGKTTPVDADGVLITDSAASGANKFLSFTNLKAFLKSANDLLYMALVAPGTSGNVLTSNGSAWTSAPAAGGSATYLYVRDEKASGTNGGTFTSGAWQTRTLNTVVTNEITGASLATDTITLPAGTYLAQCRAPSVGADQHKLKLRNTTDSTDVIIGASCNSNGTTSTDASAWVKFTIVGAKDFQLQHRCNTTSAVIGLGINAGFSVVEVYAEVFITKLA